MGLGSDVAGAVFDSLVDAATDGALDTIGNFVPAIQSSTTKNIDKITDDINELQRAITTLETTTQNIWNQIITDQKSNLYGDFTGSDLYTNTYQYIYDLGFAGCLGNTNHSRSYCETHATKVPAGVSFPNGGTADNVLKHFAKNCRNAYFTNGKFDTDLVATDLGTLLDNVLGNTGSIGIIEFCTNVMIGNMTFLANSNDLSTNAANLTSVYTYFCKFINNVGTAFSNYLQYETGVSTSGGTKYPKSKQFLNDVIQPALIDVTGCFLLNFERMVLSQFDPDTGQLPTNASELLNDATWLAILNGGYSPSGAKTPDSNYAVKQLGQNGLILRVYLAPGVAQKSPPRVVVSVANDKSKKHTYSPKWFTFQPSTTMSDSWFQVCGLKSDGKTLCEFGNCPAALLYEFVSLKDLTDDLGLPDDPTGTALNLDLEFDQGTFRESYNYPQKNVKFGYWNSKSGKQTTSADDSTVYQAFVTVDDGLTTLFTQYAEFSDRMSSTFKAGAHGHSNPDKWARHFDHDDAHYPARMDAVLKGEFASNRQIPPPDATYSGHVKFHNKSKSSTALYLVSHVSFDFVIDKWQSGSPAYKIFGNGQKLKEVLSWPGSKLKPEDSPIKTSCKKTFEVGEEAEIDVTYQLLMWHNAKTGQGVGDKINPVGRLHIETFKLYFDKSMYSVAYSSG